MFSRPYILGPRQVHDLVEGLPTIILPDRVALFVAHMVVCGNENTNCIIIWTTRDQDQQAT